VNAISGGDFCRLLEARGWVVKRIAGSHHIDAKTGRRVRISVPAHGATTLKLGLERHLMKLAGIKESDL
jgi:predicted RNA binding protein YcfA (HicA-like mRNA interferase family)